VDHNKHLDRSLGALGQSMCASVPDGFMDGVWQRAGELGAIADRRMRMALFAGLFVVGLGAGIGTTQSPAYAGPAAYSIDASSQLAPSVLLHFEP